MKLEFTCIAEDFEELFKIKWPQEARRRRRDAWRSVIYLVVLVGFWLSFMFGNPLSWIGATGPWTPSSTFNWRQKDPAPFVIAFVSLVGMIAYYVFQRRRRRGMAYLKSHPVAEQPRTILIDEDSIHSLTPLYSASYRWAMFSGWVETANLFALRLTGRHGVLVLPKRAASDEQQKELRELFKIRIVNPTGAFPVTIISDSAHDG